MGLASSTEDYAELSDVLGAGELSLKGEKAPETTYSKIPFFALKYKAKKATNAKTVQQCQNLCSGNKVCKSFSFSVRKRDCFVQDGARVQWTLHLLFKACEPQKAKLGWRDESDEPIPRFCWVDVSGQRLDKVQGTFQGKL